MQQLFAILQAARTYAVRLVGAYKVEVSFMDSNLGVVDHQVTALRNLCPSAQVMGKQPGGGRSERGLIRRDRA